MKKRTRAAALILLLVVAVVAIPLVGSLLENGAIRAERERVHGLVRVGQRLDDAQALLGERGYRFYGDGPTRYLGYRQLLVIVGDPEPTLLDAVCYSIGCGNPLRTESPFVAISASLEGRITSIE